MSKIKLTVLFLVAALLSSVIVPVIMIVGALLSEPDSEKDIYCEMVEANLKNSRFGWVDYRGTYDTECN